MVTSTGGSTSNLPTPGERAAEDPGVLVLYNSRLSWLAPIITPTILIVGPLLGMIVVGPNPVPIALVLLGLGLGWVTLFDQPRRVVMDAEGIHRVCVLRTQTLPWDEVDVIERNGRTGRRVSRTEDPEFDPRTGGYRHRPKKSRVRTGRGLAARSRRVRYLLLNTTEGEVEYKTMCELVERAAPGLIIRAVPPKTTSTPTTVYRRGVEGLVDYHPPGSV